MKGEICTDTERLIILNGKLEIPLFNDLPEQKLTAVRHFVEITSHLQEIQQLFRIFKFNIERLRESYTLMSNGDVLCGERNADSEDDYIAINAYIVNILGSGRTLVEAMDLYISENKEIDESVRKTYFDYEHDLYDTSFAYRLLIRLRDLTQHGHLAVSKVGNNYSFDLKQITEKPHFSHNKKLGDEIKRISTEIIETYRDAPTISLTQAVAEYVSKLFMLYQKFWQEASSEFHNSYAAFESVLRSYPGNSIKGKGEDPVLFVYEIINGAAQAVPISSDFIFMYEQFRRLSGFYPDGSPLYLGSGRALKKEVDFLSKVKYNKDRKGELEWQTIL